MKKISLLICIAALSISSCKKTEQLPAPTSLFTLGLAMSTQGTTFTPVNASENAISYLWDLGDGTTSTERVPTFTLNKTGDYKISLTVKNEDGSTSTSTQKVSIVAPAINLITITDLQKWHGWDFSTLKSFVGGDVWVEIKKSEKTGAYKVLADGSYDYPLFYMSPAVRVSADNSEPILIKISDKVILDKDPSRDDNVYSFNFYVKDNTGVHLLFTSEFLGSVFVTNLVSNSYSWRNGFGTSVELKGSYY